MQKLKNNEARPKFIGSYKKKRVLSEEVRDKKQIRFPNKIVKILKSYDTLKLQYR